MKYHPIFEPAAKPMTLGTAQFGFKYGITNIAGQVLQEDAIHIIRRAITEGIVYVDTAAVYGNSEVVLGTALRSGWSDKVKIITKIAPFDKSKIVNYNSKKIATVVANSFLKSCLSLQVEQIDTLMLHRADDLKIEPVLEEMKRLKEEGLIENIGVSVQTPDELKLVLDNQDIFFIQMPFNILDTRWDTMIEEIKSVRNQRELCIHARSALLQGLLCSEDQALWERAGFGDAHQIRIWLDKKHKEYGYKSISDLCISFVNSQDWIDSVVIGVQNLNDLLANLKAISMPLMTNTVIDELATSRPRVNVNSLNPAKWQANV